MEDCEIAMNEGPGELDVGDVSRYTVAISQWLDARQIMACASAINDTNEAYFDDTRPGGLNVRPVICFTLQWRSRFRPDLVPNSRADPYGVYAETDLRIYQPFKQNQVVTVQGQYITRRKIRSGVFTADRYSMTDSSGSLLAELDYNGITIGATLNGPDQAI